MLAMHVIRVIRAIGAHVGDNDPSFSTLGHSAQNGRGASNLTTGDRRGVYSLAFDAAAS